MEQVEVTQVGDGWVWKYSDGNGARLASNVTYADPARAQEAARRAYPDLEVFPVDRQTEDEPAAGRSTARRSLLVLLVVLSALVGIALWWRATRSREAGAR